MIDILMAAYNGEKYIGQQLESILRQSYKDWRLIIHDDGSEDNTAAIIKVYAENYPDKIVFIEDGIRTGGAKNNFYHILKHSDSEYIMFADQDDVWRRDKVSAAYKKIREAEKGLTADMPLLLHGDLRVVDSEMRLIDRSMFNMQKLDRRKNSFKDYLVQNNVTGCTIIMNRSVAKLCRSMPDEAIMHDWWLALIASAFGRVIYMGNAGICYRQHENNAEGAKRLNNPLYLVKKLFSRKEVKQSLRETYEQAAGFMSEYADELDEEKKAVLAAYLSLGKGCKLKKYAIMAEYGFMKSGLSRKLGYILYI